MNRTLLILAAIVLLTTFVQAQDTSQAKTPIALENQFNADIQKLNADSQRQANAIKQAYVDGLKLALKALAQTNNPDPDQIAKLSAKIKEVQATIIHPNFGQAEPVAAVPVIPRISGRWQEGSTIKKFQKDGSVPTSAGKLDSWVQDGSVVLVLYGNGMGWDRVVLSSDGKTMSGLASDGHTPITYTFLGD